MKGNVLMWVNESRAGSTRDVVTGGKEWRGVKGGDEKAGYKHKMKGKRKGAKRAKEE